MTRRAAALAAVVVKAIRAAQAELEIEGLAHDERTDIVDALVMELTRIAGVASRPYRSEPELADVLELAWRDLFGPPTGVAAQTIARLRHGDG